MIHSISQRRLVARYLLLYCLFGVVVGVQLSSGNWVVEVFNYWPITGGHLLMAFTMSGLLLGELCYYPSDKQLSIDGVLAASISDVPNTMLQDAQHLAATKGKARLNLSIYSTSRDYVSQLLRALRHQGAVSRVAIKRSGKLS